MLTNSREARLTYGTEFMAINFSNVEIIVDCFCQATSDFGKDFIDTRHFEMTNGDQKLQLEKIGDTGLRLWLKGFNFSL